MPISFPNRRLLDIAALASLSLAPLGALAQTPSAPQSRPAAANAAMPEHPAIEPGALKILQTASRRLSGATTLTFTAITTYEAYATTGQPLYYTTQSSVLVKHPDQLRVLTPGDGPASDFYYDGKTMTAFSPKVNLVASAPAPPDLTEMLKAAYDKADIAFPFAPLLAPDPYKNLSIGLTSAFVVGQSHVVGGTITDIVAFTNKNVQGELWVGIYDGLPRLLQVVYLSDPAHMRYRMEFRDWRRNATLAPAAFHFTNVTKAGRIDFARPDAPGPEAAK